MTIRFLINKVVVVSLLPDGSLAVSLRLTDDLLADASHDDEDDDGFAGADVAQLLAGHGLDGGGVGLERLEGVLQGLDLGFESLLLGLELLPQSRPPGEISPDTAASGDAGEPAGAPVRLLVMELVEGEDLAERINNEIQGVSATLINDGSPIIIPTRNANRPQLSGP